MLNYVLDETKFEGDKSEIGGIMQVFQSELYKKTGLNLCLTALNNDLLEELNEQMHNQSNLQVLNEEVLWKNSTINEKAGKILSYIDKIIVKETQSLVITDPYFFAENKNEKKNEEYIELITTVLRNCKSKHIKIITNEKNMKKNNNIEKALIDNDIKFNITHSNEFHDRFWLCPNTKKGFVMGTSLNGIGSKISCIYDLSQEDVKDLLEYIDKI